MTDRTSAAVTRLAEAAVQAAAVLTAVLAPFGSRTVGGTAAVAVAVAYGVLTAVAYAVHAVTFDSLRITGGARTGDRTKPGCRR